MKMIEYKGENNVKWFEKEILVSRISRTQNSSDKTTSKLLIYCSSIDIWGFLDDWIGKLDIINMNSLLYNIDSQSHQQKV